MQMENEKLLTKQMADKLNAYNAPISKAETFQPDSASSNLINCD